MIDENKQKRWKQGKFLKGELEEYLDQADGKQIEKVIGIKNKSELPPLVYTIASADKLHRLREKNKRKTIKLPHIAENPNESRFSKIQEELANFPRLLKQKYATKEEVSVLRRKVNKLETELLDRQNDENNSQKPENNKKIKERVEDELRNAKIDTVISEWELSKDDVKHLHRSNLDEASDTTNE